MYFVPLVSGAWAPHSVTHHTGNMERGWHFRLAASEQCTDARPLRLDGDDSTAASTVTDRSLRQCDKTRKEHFAQARTAHAANGESPRKTLTWSARPRPHSRAWYSRQLRFQAVCGLSAGPTRDVVRCSVCWRRCQVWTELRWPPNSVATFSTPSSRPTPTM